MLDKTGQLDLGTHFTIRPIHLLDEFGLDDAALRIRSTSQAESTAALMSEVVEAASAGQALLAYEVDARRSSLEQELDGFATPLAHALHRVLWQIDAVEHARLRVLRIEQALDRRGLAVPQPRPWRTVAVVALLTVMSLGELYLVSPAFQILGLADERLVWFLPFTYQHLAAVSAVLSLLVLAHAVAVTVTVRRPATDDEDHSGPGGRWISPMVGAVAVIAGVAAVREMFLRHTARSDPWAGTGFVLLNLGLVIAASWLTRPDPRPEADRYAAAVRQVRAAEQALDDATLVLGDLAERHDELVERRELLLSACGHELRALVDDANRRIRLVAGHAGPALPDTTGHDGAVPVSELAPFGRQIIAHLHDDQTVATPFVRYERVDVAPLDRRHHAMALRLAAQWSAGPPPAPSRRVPRQSPEATAPTAQDTSRGSESA